MHTKKIVTSCVLILASLTSSSFAEGGCQIESGPIPELAGYSRSVDARIADIRKTGITNTSNCGITSGGASAGADRALETIDRAFLELPVFDNTFLDFQFNIKLAINGETRAPVSRDVVIFNQVEKKITVALGSIANQCNLNETVKAEFITLLRENQALENLYKQAALGTPVVPTGLSEKNKKVAEAINKGYVPTATEGCKNKSSGSIGDSIEEIIQKSMKAMEGIGKLNEGVMVDWKRGIAIFQGLGSGGRSIEETMKNKGKQLQQELTRNGFSPRMADTMLKNFDCFKAKTTGDDSFMAQIKAKASCLSNPILGIESVTLLPLRKKVEEAKTINERVQIVNQLSDKQVTTVDVQKMYSEIEIMKTPAIDVRSDLMSNLIDLHISVLTTAEAIEKRLPKIYKDCMKGQPDVACPKQTN